MRLHFASILRQWPIVVLQILLLIGVLFLLFILWHNGDQHLQSRGIAHGLKFLNEKSGFDIIMHLIAYNENSTYFTVFMVGILNTLLVSIIAIMLASFLGLLIGVLQLSQNRVISKLSVAYIEVVRNIPLLLQLFFWYFVVLRAAPAPSHSIDYFHSIFISNRGIALPQIHYAAEGFVWEVPHFTGFNFEGGITIIPEFIALTLSLSIYTAAFIGEIVRMGIHSVPAGQKEAGLSLGLTRFQVLKNITIPEALQVILPPLTNQYVNLTKNSSLATAIAYPDLVSVFAGTALNQTGQAIEIISMTMAVYLFISLMISALMVLYEKKTRSK